MVSVFARCKICPLEIIIKDRSAGKLWTCSPLSSLHSRTILLVLNVVVAVLPFVKSPTRAPISPGSCDAKNTAKEHPRYCLELIHYMGLDLSYHSILCVGNHVYLYCTAAPQSLVIIFSALHNHVCHLHLHHISRIRVIHFPVSRCCETNLFLCDNGGNNATRWGCWLGLENHPFSLILPWPSEDVI